MPYPELTLSMQVFVLLTLKSRI